jgi:SOS-response transcriptional repressor LexA
MVSAVIAMPRNNYLPVGHGGREGDEKATRPKTVLFKKSEWELVENAPLPPGTALATAMHDLTMRAVRGEIDWEGKTVIPGLDSVRVPNLGTATAGPFREVVAEAEHITLSREIALEMGANDNDVFVRARGESMEGAGIMDEMLVLIEPLARNADPRRGQIALVQIVKEDGTYHSTIKRWFGRDEHKRPILKDGAGEVVPVPADIQDAFAVGVAVSVMGRL